ncbi:uncharacterized protein TrAFT101_009782 [Trichoderma asperellum]|uniref:Uncharacterized protein n=1 Tax=Trichoderma asperellum (strain ATCC 204424 / CBS 433.97 / NBRC 101777) TaxID=1042311 RepID=A0A2T3Z9W7_TRIA4|nr:hypothetical protein M441DRAFT_26796 [Trichoderma asperellum CBS 433.97]PTB41608.1 hypothetical protein M441DRAFT_26796 [Trichoderma asperellum CBS 433.97]UKZ94929.1 hypothetical protein TrAFT101_009782 [Trichoderma asperellum]
MAGPSDTKERHDEIKRENRVQASTSPQMQQWVSQSGKDDPWTPLRHVASTARHVVSDPTIEDKPRDTLESCATQRSTQGIANI